jgi:hypothetical protein
VLYVAAHPDDENTQLITYLARGRGYRTAYLSLTRGDGGQNVIGPELFEELGVIRTQELLAARRLDGGQQFFTRALDFGYSKHVEEALRIWDRQAVLSDVVRVVRMFRPDVMMVRFNPDTDNTHGHHTGSAVLGREAFKIAGDPSAFPEQLSGRGALKVWQPKRVLLNGGGFGRGGGTNAGAIQIDVGGNDPLTGESFASIAGRSRAMHKTQGFGNFGGGGGRGGAARESFTVLGGDPATKDIMDGVDTTWARFPGGAEVGSLSDQLIAKFDQQNLAANVPALLEIRSRLAPLPTDDRVVNEKRRQLDRIIQSCLGLTIETTIPSAEVVPGETLKLHHVATIRSTVPVRWTAVRYPSIGKDASEAIALQSGQSATRDSTQTLPPDTLMTQPYWRRQEGTPGMFRVDDPTLIGLPENPPIFPVENVFEVGGQTLVLADQPVQVTSDPAKGETRRRLDAIPPVSLSFLSEVALFAPGSSHPVTVQAIAYRAGVSGSMALDAPKGWTITPAAQPFQLASIGQSARLTFTVTAPGQLSSADITAHATVGSAVYSYDRKEIRYDHIPLQLLQPQATIKAVCLDMAIRGKQVGYLQGAGDTVSECLEQMGYSVKQLTVADLIPDQLKNFDAIVIGVRALDTRADLRAALPTLFAYAEAGGNVIIQYNRNNGSMQTAPLPLQISGDRITDETASPTFLAGDHPALNTPNKITPADFDGWVQERGIYFPNQWDNHYTPILGFSDPGEQQQNGALLIAQHGKGYIVYSGLVWFRELPAGVPGAYRLFANLVSLGK